MFSRAYTLPKGSFFLFGPRATGKTTWLRSVLPSALWIDLLQMREVPFNAAREVFHRRSQREAVERVHAKEIEIDRPAMTVPQGERRATRQVELGRGGKPRQSVQNGDLRRWLIDRVPRVLWAPGSR